MGWERGTARWFLLPALAVLLIFRGVPLLGAVLIGFTDWDAYGATDIGRVMITGLENYVRLSGDADFWQALRTALLVTAIGVPMQIGLALALARELHEVVEWGQSTLRRTLFLPVVTTLVAGALAWTHLLQSERSLLNQGLAWLGWGPIPWWSDPAWAFWALIVMAVWQGFGYNMVVFFMARQGLDPHLYEQAKREGATPWQQFRQVTLPLLRRAVLFAGVVTAIGYLQIFTEPYVATDGGPQGATTTLVLYLYKHAFRYFRLGYATAVALALFWCCLVLLLIRSRLRQELAGNARP